MRTKIKITLSILILLLLSSLFSLTALSANRLEVSYPKVGSYFLSPTSTFTQYIKYSYRFLVWITGIVATLILTIAGVSYITSTGNPAKMEKAKEGIIAGLIGAVVVFSSYLLLYTINPQRTKLKLNPNTPPVRLVGLAQPKGGTVSTLISIPIDVDADIPGVEGLGLAYGYEKFSPTEICCSSSLPYLKEIDVYPEKDFKGNTTTITGLNGCYRVAIGSVKFIWNPHPLNLNKGGLEIKYPTIGNSPSAVTLKDNSTFSDFIKYLYRFIIWIAGIIVVLILIGGGIAYATSAGNPAKMKNARSVIIAGIIGLIVILSTYLIIKTINPQIGNLRLQSSSNLGIWLEDYKGDKLPVGDDMPEISPNFEAEKICFPTSSSSSSDSLLKKEVNGLYLFPKGKYEGKGTYFSSNTKGCQDISSLDVKSIKIYWNFPGVYFYIYNDDNSVVPFSVRNDQLNLEKVLGDFYEKNWANISVNNGPDHSHHLVVIFYTDEDYQSQSYETGDYHAGGWIQRGATPRVIFPYDNYPFHPDTNHIYKNPPKIYSLQIFDQNPGGSASVWLYKAANYMERDESGNDLTCPNFCPYKKAMLFPQDLSPNRFAIYPHKKGCANEVESLRTLGLTILIDPCFTPGPHDPSPFSVGQGALPFRRAQTFSYNEPDISKNYIGQCGSKSWHHMFRYIPQSCAQYIMLIPIKH